MLFLKSLAEFTINFRCFFSQDFWVAIYSPGRWTAERSKGRDKACFGYALQGGGRAEGSTRRNAVRLGNRARRQRGKSLPPVLSTLNSCYYKSYLKSYSGRFSSQSCDILPFMDMRMPFKSGLFWMNVLRDFDLTFSSAFTSMGHILESDWTMKSISIVELATLW